MKFALTTTAMLIAVLILSAFATTTAQAQVRSEPMFEERPDLGAKVARNKAKSIALRPPGGLATDSDDGCGSLDIGSFDSGSQGNRAGRRIAPREIVVITGDVVNTPTCRR